MRTAGTEFQSNIAGEVTTLAMLWKLSLTDGTFMYFTDHDQNLVVNGNTYIAATGFTPSTVESKNDMAVDNLDVIGILDSSAITEADLMAGKYDYAEVEVYLINYTASNLNNGLMQIRRGWLGEVSVKRNQFTAEVRGMTDIIQRQLGELYSPSCRAILGDTKCAFNMGTNTWTGGTQTGPAAQSTAVAVTSVTSRQIFTASSLNTRPFGFYTGGELIWTTGTNSGLKMEIKEFTNTGLITLVLPMPYDVDVADQFTIKTGCDKSFGTCIAKFNNAVNFRGEPHVPGMDKSLETSSTRTSE